LVVYSRPNDKQDSDQRHSTRLLALNSDGADTSHHWYLTSTQRVQSTSTKVDNDEKDLRL